MKKVRLVFAGISGAMCADVLLRIAFLAVAVRRNGFIGFLDFLVKQSGLWLTLSVLLCAAMLGVGLREKALGKAAKVCLALTLFGGIFEKCLFHFRFLPGKAGVYAFFILLPLVGLCRVGSVVLCVKNALSALKKELSQDAPE